MYRNSERTDYFNQFFSGDDIREPLTFGILAALLIALVYSPYLLSVCMFGIIALVFLEPGPRLRLGWSGLRLAIKRIRKSPALASSSVFFLIVLLGGLYSSDMGYWLERLRIKVPLLALPFAVAALPPLTSRQLEVLLSGWILLLTITSIGVGVNYALHFEHVQELLKKGQSIPVPTNHIRFSLMMAIGVVSAVWLSIRNRQATSGFLNPTTSGVLGIFLFLFLHLLAVRSGLAVLYISLGLMAIREAWLRRKWWLAIAPFIILTLLPLVMYFALPSFKAKVHYMLWDRKMHLSGQGAAYSDSGRIISLQTGIHIWESNFWLGTGPGDLKNKIQEEYQQQYGDAVKPILPHNQWLSIAAGSGLFGLLSALIAFFAPLIDNRQYRHRLFLAVHLILFFSFLVENTIENAVGAGLYTAFLFILMSHVSVRSETEW